MRATADKEKTKPDPVERWRTETLVRAGYDDYTAALLAAQPDVDLHEAIDLIRGGCRQSVALQILL